MDIKLLGYSERGMMNALADDIHHSTDPTSTLSEFLSWFDFPMTDSPPCFQDIENATLLVEQSFSDFGDLDLLILLEHRDKRRQAILIEAKVSNDTNSWRTVEDRWDEFTQMLNGGEGTTSNLFVQLHRKVRMVKFLLSKKDGYEPDIFTPRGSQGTNQVVGRAIELVREYIGDGNVWYGAILPDETGELDAFASETLRSSHVDQSLTARGGTPHFVMPPIWRLAS